MIDTSTMLGTFIESFSGLEELLNVWVVFLGIVLTGMAVFKFVELGRFGDQPGGVRWITPIMYLLSGAALFNFAASIDTFLETIYSPSTSVHNLIGYSPSSTMSQPKLMIKALIACIQLYGYFTYARGWLSVRRIGSGQNGSDEVFKSAMIRIFSGVALINITGTVNVVSNTFGFGKIF